MSNAASLKEELDTLDARIKRLRVEYEQYFLRVLKREPLFLRGQVEKTIAYLSQQYISNTGFKFRFRNLADKYNSYRHYWTRVLKEIEDGSYHRRAAEEGAGGVATPAGEEASGAAAAGPGDEFEEMVMRELYREYVLARKKCLEPIDNINYETLRAAISKRRAEAAARYGTDNFDFRVAIKDGRSRILVVPGKKDEGD
jgi:hypothetical protein